MCGGLTATERRNDTSREFDWYVPKTGLILARNCIEV